MNCSLNELMASFAPLCAVLDPATKSGCVWVAPRSSGSLTPAKARPGHAPVSISNGIESNSGLKIRRSPIQRSSLVEPTLNSLTLLLPITQFHWVVQSSSPGARSYLNPSIVVRSLSACSPMPSFGP